MLLVLTSTEKHTNSLCGQNVEYLNAKLCKPTIRLQGVNYAQNYHSLQVMRRLELSP